MIKTILILLMLLIPFNVSAQAKKNLNEKEKVINFITETAKKERVDVNFCLSIARVESNFDSQAHNDNTFNFTKNSKNIDIKYGSQERYVSRGVMQVTIATGKFFNKNIKTTRDLYDMKKNVIAGVRYIKYIFNKYPKYTYVQVAQIYNLGETAYFNGKRNTDYENKFMRHFMKYSNN